SDASAAGTATTTRARRARRRPTRAASSPSCHTPAPHGGTGAASGSGWADRATARTKARLLGRVRLEDRPAERAHRQLDCDPGGSVLVVVDRIHLDDVEAVHHAGFGDE